MIQRLLLPTLLLATLLVSCGDDLLIPKPPTYLRVELPDHTYTLHEDTCQYNFKLAELYTIEAAPSSDNSQCHRRIQLGPLNGTVYFRYWDMEEPLAYYVNNANDEIDRHKGKAFEVTDNRVIRPEDKVYGTIFSLKGDVATPFQFYLTDSTDHFVYGEILFNSAPKYDSLKPSLDYLKVDLDTLLQTFKWER